MAINLGSPTGTQKYITAGNVNVITSFDWAVFDGRRSGEVPQIELVEYQPIGDQFVNRAIKFGKSYSELSEGDAYKDTYYAKPTGNKYIFPFFTPEMRSKSNNWGEDASLSELATKGVNKITDSLGTFGKIAGAVTQYDIKPVTSQLMGSNLGVEYPKIWQGPDASATYTFDFFLHNTVTMEKVADNWKLVYLLSHNNSYNRRSLVLQDAPVLYKVIVPGVRYSPVSSMKQLQIDMIGQIRKISDFPGLPGAVNLPEAYHITITMEDLYAESRQILQAINKGNVVEVFNDSNELDGLAASAAAAAQIISSIF